MSARDALMSSFGRAFVSSPTRFLCENARVLSLDFFHVIPESSQKEIAAFAAPKGLPFDVRKFGTTMNDK